MDLNFGPNVPAFLALLSSGPIRCPVLTCPLHLLASALTAAEHVLLLLLS